MNPEAVLALISELYSNLSRATATIADLQQQIQAQSVAAEDVSSVSGTAFGPTPPTD